MLNRTILAWMLAAAAALPVAAAPISIHGRIVDEEGEPVAGVAVRLMPATGDYTLALDELAGRFAAAAAETASDRQGRFELAAPAPGLWRVWIDAEGVVPLETRLEPLVEEIELPVAELVPAVGVEVRVRGDGGKPLAGTRLAAGSHGRQRGGLWQPRRWRGITGEDGKTRIPTDREGTVALDAFHPGYLPQRRELIRRGAVTLRLERGRPRAIEVRDPDGQPLAGVVARVGEGSLPAGVTGDDGRLVLAAPRAGTDERLPFELRSREFQPLSSHLTVSDAEPEEPEGPGEPEEPERPLVFELSPAPFISGRVLDDATREPVAEVLVWSTGRPESLVTTDLHGAFRLVSAAAGKGRGAAASAGYLPASWQAQAGEDGEDLAATVSLAPCSSVRGRVVDEQGDPVAGVEVEAITQYLTMSRRPWGRRNRLDHHTARSDASGRFRIRSLQPETTYDLSVSLGGYAPRRQSFVAPALRQTGEVEVVLLRGRRGSGWVVDAGDQPVAGAEVTLERQAEGNPMSLWLRAALGIGPDFRAASDAEGRYQLSDLAAGRYWLTARGAGFAAAVVPGVEVPAGAGEVELGTVVLSPGADVEGRVVDASGAPLGDVEVLASSQEEGYGQPGGSSEPARAVSDAGGGFRIADRRAGAKIHLAASKAGFVTARVAGVEAPTREPVIITLEPATRVSGRVIGGDGEPIAGARVSLWVETMMPTGGDTRSDDRGRFVIEGVGTGRASLNARADGRLRSPQRVVEVPPEGLEDLEIVLRRGSAVVFGVILDPRGEPVAEAHVAVRVRTKAESFGHSASTGGDGTFRIEKLEPGRGVVDVYHPEYPALSRTLEVEPGENRVELQLEGGLEVTGQVVAKDGAPVAGASVEIIGRGPRATRRQAVTGAGGDFELSGLIDGRYTLSARHTEYASARLDDDVVVAGQAVRGLVVQLDQGAVISGRLLGVELDELSALSIRASTEGDFKIGEVDFEARYRISRASPGRWRIDASTAGGRQGRAMVTVAPGEREVTADVELGLGSTLSGRVLARDQPVSGAHVSVDGTDVAVSTVALSDYLGRYELNGLEPGHYRLTVQLPAAGWSLHRQIRIDGDRTLDLVLELTRVAGRVVDAADRSPVAGARVALEPVWDDGAGTTSHRGGHQETSGEDGRFDLGEVAPGSRRLSATKQGYSPAETVLDVAAGDDLTGLELALQATAGLWLTVSHDLVPELNHLQAAVLDGAGRTIAAGDYPIEDEGRVHLPTVPAGSWLLVVGARGIATVSLPVTAPDDRPRIVLVPGSGVQVSVPELAEDQVTAHAELRAAGGELFRTPSWSGVRSRFPLRFGEGTVRGLAAGVWSLRVTAADGRTWSASVTAAPGTIEPVRLE